MAWVVARFLVMVREPRLWKEGRKSAIKVPRRFKKWSVSCEGCGIFARLSIMPTKCHKFRTVVISGQKLDIKVCETCS